MSKTDYDLFAEEFSKTRQLPWNEAVTFLESLPKNAKILDIGCGNGRHLIEAEKRGLNAIGLDISKNLLKIAKRKTGALLILGNALALPFKNRAFDSSICIAVVHHFKEEKERMEALKEAVRVSKSAILVSVWAFEQKKFAKRKSSRSASLHSKLYNSSSCKSQDIQLGWNKKFPRFYHLFREGEIEMLAEKAGLKVKKSWRSGGNYWAIVGR